LCYFLGLFGVHRFYEGDKKWGIIYLCTLGIFGYGWLFDMFRILVKPTRYPKKNR
jgi:restriction system protein